jgi:3'-5' exoribonuclease
VTESGKNARPTNDFVHADLRGQARMPGKKIADLTVGELVTATYAVKDKSLASFRNKPGQYLSLTLGDASGEITARMWDNAEQAAKLFETGDAVTVRGKVESYRGQMQLVIERLKKADEPSYEQAELLPQSPRDLDEYRERLFQYIEEVRDPRLRTLVDAFFGDEEFLERFCALPGAKALHHAHVGGLLEHTVGVVEILRTVCDIHQELDRDLVIAGALLHDIGKIEELEAGAAFDYTDAGRLVGHIVLTDRMVTDAIEDIEDFPEELANRLTHLLLSHHGQKEYGAPVLPMTTEACALHYADNLDAHVQYFSQVVQAGADSGNRWSDYQRLFDRYIYLGGATDQEGEKVGGD